jgi:hypothetical protein
MWIICAFDWMIAWYGVALDVLLEIELDVDLAALLVAPVVELGAR